MFAKKSFCVLHIFFVPLQSQNKVYMYGEQEKD